MKGLLIKIKGIAASAFLFRSNDVNQFGDAYRDVFKAVLDLLELNEIVTNKEF